jgi:hypothetical protein
MKGSREMLINLKNNKSLFCGAFIFAIIYLFLFSIFSLDALIIILNGLFFGSVTAIIFAFGKILVNSIKGVTPYDRVEQMTIGFFLAWFALILLMVASVYLHASGQSYKATFLAASGRYVAIVAAWVQLTAPDFGLGIFHGRDRKILYSSVLIGGIISLVFIYIQNFQILA